MKNNNSAPSVFIFLLATLSLTIFSTWAGPTGFSSQAANIVQNGSITTVSHQADAAVINWQTFNVDAHEVVHFNQPGSHAALLNRIHDMKPSEIHGQVHSNGQLFFINANGLIFGKNARVNVGSLFATTLDISDEDFRQGKYHFSTPHMSSGRIINRGEIRAASHGFVALVGNSVSNQGRIVAELGHVHLAAGRAVIADFHGDGLMHIQVTAEVLVNDEGQQDAVHNSGLLQADEGKVHLQAYVAQKIFTHAVNNEGVLHASSVHSDGGEIFLLAPGGRIVNRGQLLARGQQKGGEIYVQAEQIGIFDESLLDASGETAGGTIELGFYDEAQATEFVYVAEHSVLQAKALTSGEGGEISIYAQTALRSHGLLNVTGATQGGTVNILSRGGLALTRAPEYAGGTWNVSADNLEIVDQGILRWNENFSDIYWSTSAVAIDPVNLAFSPLSATSKLDFTLIQASTLQQAHTDVNVYAVGATTGNIVLAGSFHFSRIFPHVGAKTELSPIRFFAEQNIYFNETIFQPNWPTNMEFIAKNDIIANGPVFFGCHGMAGICYGVMAASSLRFIADADLSGHGDINFDSAHFGFLTGFPYLYSLQGHNVTIGDFNALGALMLLAEDQAAYGAIASNHFVRQDEAHPLGIDLPKYIDTNLNDLVIDLAPKARFSALHHAKTDVTGFVQESVVAPVLTLIGEHKQVKITGAAMLVHDRNRSACGQQALQQKVDVVGRLQEPVICRKSAWAIEIDYPD